MCHAAGDGLARVGDRHGRRSNARYRHQRAILAGPTAVFLVRLVRIAPVEGCDQVQSTIHRRAAPGQRGAIGIAVTFVRGHATVDVRLEAFKAGVEDEVRDARDRVGAVGRRGTAGHDTDIRNEALWQQVDIGIARDIGWHHAPTIEQHEVAVGAEVAQVEETADAQRGAATNRTGRGGARHRRQLGQRLRDGLRIVLQQLFGRQRRDRRWRGHAFANDSRAGDDDLLEVFFDRIFCGKCGRRYAAEDGGDSERNEVRRRGALLDSRTRV